MSQFDNTNDFQLREESIDGGKTLSLKMLRTGLLSGLVAAIIAVTLSAGYDQYHAQIYQYLFPPKVVVYTGPSIYTIGSDGAIYALQATTGAIRWKSSNQFIGLSNGAIIGVADHTVIAYDNNGAIIGVNAATGAVRWVYQVGQVYFQPIFSGETVIATGTQMKNGIQIYSIVALNIAAGKVIWQDTLPYYLAFCGMSNGVFTVVMEQENPSNPGYYSYSQQQTYEIERINPATGATIWKNSAQDNAYIAASAMFVGSDFLIVYSQTLLIEIRMSNGAIVFQKHTQTQNGYWETDSFAVIGASEKYIYLLRTQNVFENNITGIVYFTYAQKIDTTGKIVWQTKFGASSLFLVNETSLQYDYTNFSNVIPNKGVSSGSSLINMLDQATGKLLYSFPFYSGTYQDNYPKEIVITDQTHIMLMQYDSFGVYNLHTGAELWSKYILGAYHALPLENAQNLYLSNVIDKTTYYFENIALQTGKVLWISNIHIPTVGTPYIGASF